MLGTENEDGSSRIFSLNNTGNQSVLGFQVHSATSGQFTEMMRMNLTGVGINTNSPQGRLHIHNPGDGSGTYTSISACQESCAAPEDTYDCRAGQGCVINTNGTGTYTGPTALQDCEDDCNHYCDLSAGGLGCNQQGVGTHVGTSCDPTTCSPTSNNETYHLFCHWDQAGNYGTLYYIDQTTFDNQCLPVIGHASGPQFSIDVASAFYVETTGACSRYVGALYNMPTPVAGDYITQPCPYNNSVT